jgi:endonuclease I
VAVGNGTDIFTWQLSGSIGAGIALVAGDATTVDSFPVDFPEEAWSSNNGLWNGKIGDGAKLLDASSAVLDSVVVDATRFENKDYVRNYGVTSPSTIFDPGEWTATSVDYPTQGSPGAHSTEPPLPAPTISSVTIDPPAPLPGQSVTVQAIVTDSVATITSVVLSWGTSPTSLPGTISMSPIYGNVYRTDTPIPGQSAGVTIYYRIEATNDLSGSTTTMVFSYTLPVVVSIHDIQGEVAASPLEGQPVITGGVVTGVYGDYAVLQDGSGPWSGLWASPAAGLTPGDSVVVRGVVIESHGPGFDGTTVLTDLMILNSVAGAELPGSTLVPTGGASAEEYEGVLLLLEDALCTDADVGGGWAADDGSGTCIVGHLGYDSPPTLGTVYDVTGILREANGPYQVEPRDASDVQWVADATAPSIAYVAATDGTSILVTFSEDVELSSAETSDNYAIPGLAVTAAARDAADFAQVLLTVTPMAEELYVLTVNDVEDFFGNAAVGAAHSFEYVDYTAPAGYYAAAAGLYGEALRAALHEIIDDHTACSYDFVWTAYYTTDDKPNGKVWDIYSDVPGGIPPYEYTFGVDEGGVGGAEGNGYTREHSWPKSWFGGEVSPMYTDLFALYPCDAHVNGNRGVYPYGEVDNPDWVSLNGSKRGPCSYPGYSGIAFEPIDAYKGDLARTYFYMSTRYDTEDAGWPGGPMTDGADLLPWAASMLLEWHEQDPVSRKEIERNGTVYGFQMNRNPFIDHPEYAELIWGDLADAGSDVPLQLSLSQNAPNPFNPSTVIRFSLDRKVRDGSLRVYDVTGRLVRTLHDGPLAAGPHKVTWDGRDEAGARMASGTYLVRLLAGRQILVRKATLIK